MPPAYPWTTANIAAPPPHIPANVTSPRFHASADVAVLPTTTTDAAPPKSALEEGEQTPR